MRFGLQKYNIRDENVFIQNKKISKIFSGVSTRTGEAVRDAFVFCVNHEHFMKANDNSKRTLL